jgi:hypothetical protein
VGLLHSPSPRFVVAGEILSYVVGGGGRNGDNGPTRVLTVGRLQEREISAFAILPDGQRQPRLISTKKNSGVFGLVAVVSSDTKVVFRQRKSCCKVPVALFVVIW